MTEKYEYEEIKADINSIAHRKLVLGVGINDADYIVTKKIGKKRINCPIYQKWCAMLKRCYDPRTQERQPTYKGCSVCNEWLLFSNFKKWMMDRDWKNKHLDKDIIKYGNKVYCPEYCCLIISELNKLLCDNHSRRGKYPLGVRKNARGGKFAALCRMNGERVSVGGFLTPYDAGEHYKKMKSEHIISIASKQEDKRVYNGLMFFSKMLMLS